LFKAVKGQNIAVKMLSQELAGGLLPQTLLFHGPDGTGKFLAAIELAKLLNCENPGADTAGENAGSGCCCVSCRTIDRLSSKNVFFVCKSNLRNTFDFWGRFGVREGSARYFLRDVRRLFLGVADEERYRKETERLVETLRDPENAIAGADKLVEFACSLIDAQKTPVISIDRVRELQRFLWMKSGDGRCKVAIVDGADRMSEEAQNSFLKISEDTPPDSVILITCTKKELLKDTIHSRFRAYRFVDLSHRVWAEIARERFGDARPAVRDGTLPGEAGARGEKIEYDPSRMREYLRRLSDASSRLGGVLELIDDIVEHGQTVQFLSYIIDVSRERLRSENRPSAERAYRMENLMKTADFHRGAIRGSSANQELSLTDFLLNNYRNILQW
jgi:DNA polymerase III delta prime subunit